MGRTTKISNEKKLESFEKALPSVFATSSTKKIIRAASKGNLEEYGKTFKEYNWARTRDYNCVLLIFSPIVAAAQSIANEVKKRGSEEPLFNENKQEDEKWIKIIDLLNKCLSNEAKLGNLCNHIGSGKGKEIEQTLKNFQDYNNLIGYLVYGAETKKSDPLIKRSKNISSWKVNGKYIRNKLIPFIKAINPKLGEIMEKSVLKTQQESNASSAANLGNAATLPTPKEPPRVADSSTNPPEVFEKKDLNDQSILDNVIKQKRKELIEKTNKSAQEEFKKLENQHKICAVEAVYSENASNLPFLKSMQFHYKIIPTKNKDCKFKTDLSKVIWKQIKLFVVFTDEDLNRFISMDLKEEKDVNEAFSRSIENINKHVSSLMKKICEILANITAKKNNFKTLEDKAIDFVHNQDGSYVEQNGNSIVINCFKLFDSEFDDEGKRAEKLKKIYEELESLSKPRTGFDDKEEEKDKTMMNNLANRIPVIKDKTSESSEDTGDWDDDGDDKDEETPNKKQGVEQKAEELVRDNKITQAQRDKLLAKFKTTHKFNEDEKIEVLESYCSDTYKNYETDDIIKIFEIKHDLGLKNPDDAKKLFEATKGNRELIKGEYTMIGAAAKTAGATVDEAISGIEEILEEFLENKGVTILNAVDAFVWETKFGIERNRAISLSLAMRSEEFKSIIERTSAPSAIASTTKETKSIEEIAEIAKSIHNLNLSDQKQIKKVLHIIKHVQNKPTMNFISKAIEFCRTLIEENQNRWLRFSDADIDNFYNQKHGEEAKDIQRTARDAEEKIRKIREATHGNDKEEDDENDDDEWSLDS